MSNGFIKGYVDNYGKIRYVESYFVGKDNEVFVNYTEEVEEAKLFDEFQLKEFALVAPFKKGNHFTMGAERLTTIIEVILSYKEQG